MKSRGVLAHPVAVARRATQRRAAGNDAGFTLIELVIVVVILPIVIGGIAAALLSVFGLQDQTQNRIGDSNDEQVSSSTFNKDVQSAQQIETATTPACGGSAQTQLVGLEWGLDANGNYDTVVSYVLGQYGSSNWIIRQICTTGASTTPTSTRVISHDAGTPTVTFNPSGFIAANSTWKSTEGLYGVTLNIVAPGSGYTYSLSGLPSNATSTGSASQIQLTQNPAGCNLASPGSGTYAKVLCFANFTGFTNTNSTACPGGIGQQMKLSIADSPDVLQFCVSDPTDNVNPYAIPTYYNPGSSGYNSEAYLGNNGFYTGIPGNPALYQLPNNGAYSVVNFTDIEVTNAVGEPATGWTLVTGDAESTDSGEWIHFFVGGGLTWSILPNSSTSLYGNSCFDAHDTGDSGLFQWTGAEPPTTTEVGNSSTGPPASGYATTLATPTATPFSPYPTGVSSILCESDQQLNKTGTLMLSSPEPASSTPQSLTVTMKGAGYQALFLGVLL